MQTGNEIFFAKNRVFKTATKRTEKVYDLQCNSHTSLIDFVQSVVQHRGLGMYSKYRVSYRGGALGFPTPSNSFQDFNNHDVIVV